MAPITEFLERFPWWLPWAAIIVVLISFLSFRRKDPPERKEIPRQKLFKEKPKPQRDDFIYEVIKQGLRRPAPLITNTAVCHSDVNPNLRRVWEEGGNPH